MDELIDKNLPYFVGGNLATLAPCAAAAFAAQTVRYISVGATARDVEKNDLGELLR